MILNDRTNAEHIKNILELDSKKCSVNNAGEYFIVPKDNKNSWLVEKLLSGVITANDILETIARNCTAWDTSEDKREGLLPKVSSTDKYLYKLLADEEYVFCNVCKRFNIK